MDATISGSTAAKSTPLRYGDIEIGLGTRRFDCLRKATTLNSHHNRAKKIQQDPNNAVNW